MRACQVPPRVARLAAGRAARTHAHLARSWASPHLSLASLALPCPCQLTSRHPLAVRSPGFNGAGAEGQKSHKARRSARSPRTHNNRIQVPHRIASHRTPPRAAASSRSPSVSRSIRHKEAAARNDLFLISPGFHPACFDCVRACVLARWRTNRQSSSSSSVFSHEQ
jgi:hypothetical protein